MAIFKPRASSKAAKEAEDIPLPKDETTPPVMKMKRVINCFRLYGAPAHSSSVMNDALATGKPAFLVKHKNRTTIAQYPYESYAKSAGA